MFVTHFKHWHFCAVSRPGLCGLILKVRRRCKRYGDDAGNTAENSIVFSLIWMRWLPSVPWRCWLGGRKDIRPVKKWGGWWRWALVSLDGVAPSRMVGVSASVNLPLYHEVQKFCSGTGSPGWSRQKGHKMVVVWWWLQPDLKLQSQNYDFHQKMM